MTPDANGYASLDLGTLAAGTYTLTAKAMYDNGDTPLEVDSAPVTFTVASFTVKTNSWSPNPAAVSRVISGQVQGVFDPTSVDGGGGGQTFVVYTWTTAGVWYSQDGTAGSFEPCGGYAIGWQQGTADTTFHAQFFAPGQYLLEVVCTASVYSQSTGLPVATFTGTGYIGGSASDIDTGGGTGHAQRVHGKAAHAASAHLGGGGGDGITVVPATVTFSDNSLIKLGIGSPQSYLKEITATVTPASQVGSVTFSATNGEVSVGTASTQNPASGQVVLGIRAVSPTPGAPGNSGTPDCMVIATGNNLLGFPPVASVPVIVYIPKSIGRPHDPNGTKTYTVTGNKIFVTGSTIPSAGTTLPDGYGYCITEFLQPTTITVWDQFKHPLDAIFTGASVGEYNDAGTQVFGINQKLSSSGTYTDVVGGGNDHYSGQAQQKGLYNYQVWENLPADVMLSDSAPVHADKSITIGGITLATGIVNRTYQQTEPNKLTISWP